MREPPLRGCTGSRAWPKRPVVMRLARLFGILERLRFTIATYEHVGRMGIRRRRERCVSSDYPGSQPPRYRQDGSQGAQTGADWGQGYSGPPPANQPPTAYDYGSHGLQAPSYLPTSPQPPQPTPAGQPSHLTAPPQPAPTPQPMLQPTPPGGFDHRNDASASRRPSWLVPVIVAALVIAVLGTVGGVVYAIGKNALQEPMNVTSAFCNDMQAQNYTGAYKLLSSGYQKQVTSQQFTEASQIHDQLDGKVKGCGLAALQTNDGFSLNLSPENASFNAQITRTHTYTGAVTLVKQNGSWKIAAIDDALQGSDIGALATGEAFCQALSQQDYATVYGMFTPAYQQQIGSVDKYVNGLKAVFGDGQFQITGCQPQLNTFSVTPQDDGASVSGAFNIKVTTDAGTLTVPVPYKMSFAKVSGHWKISDLEVVQSQG